METIEYVGIDYHTKFALATRMDRDGTKAVKQRVNNTKSEIREFLGSLPVGSEVVIEATNNWYAFVEWSADLPINVKLAHPSKTKAIASARIKTDTIDSKILADLLRSNFIAESYLAPQDVRDVRELVRFRTTLVRIRTQFVTRIHSVLFKVGERIEASDITGKKARQQIKELNLRPVYQSEIDGCFEMSDELSKQIKKLEVEIQKQANLSADAKLLMTIPGISFFSSLLITSEIGDYQRFANSRKLASFAGLVPSVHASGGKTRLGSITKTGSTNLRFVLLQAVPHLIKKSKRFNALYQRVKAKHGGGTARIAVCRQLLGVMLSMLKKRQEFRLEQNQEGKLDSC